MSAPQASRRVDEPFDGGDHQDRYDVVCNRGGLTRRQLLIWAGDRLAAGAPVFVEAGLLHLRGALDSVRFIRAFGAVREESDALGSGLREVGGWPHRVDAAVPPPVLELVDLTRNSAPERALRDLAGERVWSCGGEAGPLVDGLLVRMAPEHHVWVLVQHQLISDAWSFKLVHQRVVEHYREAGGAPLPLPQFRDYIDYERRYRASSSARWARGHWRRSHAAARPDEVGGGRDATRLHRVVQPLGRARTRAIRLRAAESASPDLAAFVVFATVVAAHLNCTAGSRDLVLNVPFANRPSARFKNTIGSFMNVCPVRVEVASGDSFRALAERIADATWEAARHQGYAGRAGAVPQPYDVLVNVHRATVAADAFDACRMEVEWLAPTHRFGAVALSVHDFGATGELSLVLDMNEATFGRAQRMEVLGSLVRLLDAALVDPTRRLDAVRLSSSPEACRVRTAEGSAGATVWGRFATQVQRAPDAVAVRAGTTTVTYEGLRDAALQVAARLVAHGVEPGAIVAVWGERNIPWLGAMLGIWCRGATYLPLDPRWPAARIARVLRQSMARAVLTGPEPPVALLALQAEGVPWMIVPPEAPTAHAAEIVMGSDAPAYVIYTSGSTGTPKGALIEQRGFLNHLDAKIALLGLAAGDRVAQTAAVSFDISLWQGLAPLLVGGQVDILDDAIVRDPVALRAAVAEHGMTILELVPPLLELLLAADERADPGLGRLRWMVATGETLPPDLCRRWLRRYAAIPLVNAYGPTECADDVTHHVVRTPPPPGATRVPIGRPIAGMTVHVVDEHLQEVAAGEAGEICVGGVGVGRGYLYDPERTAAAFVAPDPFDGRAGTRLYRTGDRGRWGADGTLEWLGRLDAQVKIRGVRVEPEEIEAVLRQHVAVRHAAVAIRAGAAGPQLLAYVVLHDGSEAGGAAARDAWQVAAWRRLWDDTYRRESLRAPEASFNTAPDRHTNAPCHGSATASVLDSLRALVHERLPEAMQPSRFIVLDALPLTTNGKVDRHALPAPACAAPVGGTGTATARNGVEYIVAAIWGELLGVGVVGRDDDFFTLGGDSLLVYHMLSAVKAALAVETTAEAFLKNPTVGGMAVAVAAAAVAGLPEADIEAVLDGLETLSDEEAALLLGPSDGPEALASERDDA
jgi:amino acid adenylation domain-containing protein